MGAASCAALPVMILDDILFAHRSLQADGAVAFELPHHSNNLLLCSFYFLDLDWAQCVHILLEHFGSALGHGTHEVIAKLVTGPFQRDGDEFPVNLCQHFLHAAL